MVVLFKEWDHENVGLILSIYGSHLEKIFIIATVVMANMLANNDLFTVHTQKT